MGQFEERWGTPDIITYDVWKLTVSINPNTYQKRRVVCWGWTSAVLTLTGGQKATCSFQAPLLWNQIPARIKETDSFSNFKIRLKAFLFDQPYS